MSEKNRLLSDSTPERKTSKGKVADLTRPVKSSAWNVDETELRTLATKDATQSEASNAESTFISDVSPAHSRGSDCELLRVHKTPVKIKDANDSPKSRSLFSEISSVPSVTPQSTKGKSQRERIKERIAAAKERAQVTVQVKSVPRKKGDTLSEEDPLSKEDEEVEEAMKRHKILRSKWKLASAGVHVAGMQSSFDFFNRSGEEQPPSLERAEVFQSLSPGREGPSPRSDRNDDDEKLLCAELLGSKEDDWLPLFKYEPPVLEDWDKLKQKQIGLFFCPSASPVPIEEKLEPDTVPRFIEDEGLYVGKKSIVPPKRRNKLEQRIMAMGSERMWFGEDGEIKGIQDPLCFHRHREYIEDVLDYSLFEYKQASILEYGTETATNLGGSYILEIDVSFVTFKHHPLFSPEDVLGSQLSSLVETRSATLTVVRRLAGRLSALRNFPSQMDERRYQLELREVRTAWLKEAKKERDVLASILETWRDLKNVRSRQNYTVTSYRLLIVTRDDPDYERTWQKEYDSYLQELEDEAEAEYRLECEEYHKKVDEWNQRRQANVEEDLAVTTTDDDELDRPKKTVKSVLREKVLNDLTASLRPVGEPLVEVELTSQGTISVTSQNDQKEQDRRLATEKTQLWVALRHNDKEVDRVKTILEPHFVYRASYRFCLRINKWPKSLALRLMESGLLNLFGRKPIAEVFIPVPGRLNTDSADWQNYEFSCSSTTGPLEHAGVGTNLNALCNGSICVRAGWALPLPHIVLTNRPMKESKSNKTNIDALKDWADQVQLDPNDPTNADLLEYIKICEERDILKKSLGGKEAGSKLSNPLDFCNMDELLSNPRLKLLSLRASGQPEFRNMKNVPINEREIPKDIFKMYEKRIAGKEKKKNKGYFFDNVREMGKGFLENAREEVLKACTQNHVKTFKEIVHEDPIPDLRTLGLTVMRWLQPKRPLRPRRKERKMVHVKNLVGQQVEIMVNVGRAFEVPVRKEGPVASTPSADEFSLVPVRPFIEVTFQDQRKRTTTADGPNPTWNQDIHIPVQCMGGVQNIRDSLFIHLYDEKVVDLVEDIRMRETTTVQRTERYWLGSLRIPFTALYTRIEGTFQLYSPPVLLGYKRESKDFRDSTFLTLFVMVHPPLTPPPQLLEKMPTVEEPSIEFHLDQWINEVKKHFPNHRVPTLVLNSEGKTVCVTRFIRAIPPPEIVAGQKSTPEMVARFVSLIPIVSNSQFFPGQMDIWLNAQEIVNHCSSEIPCRAALLACFLKYFFERTYLLVGTGAPGGPSVFVLTFPSLGSKTAAPTIWDPSTSQKHAPGDPFSPLSSLHAIIDHTNIWVNLQKEELISQLNLDVTKRSSDWWPAFGRAIAAPTNSVQPEVLETKETPESEVKLLQDRLEKILRNAIMKLRTTNRTIWNRYCSTSLRKLLPGLEMNTWTAETSSPPDHFQELEHISSSYKMCGFPINLPYASPSTLVEAVKSTGVHLNDAPEMEFSVAVYVRPFPSNVLSVWVYVASLIRKR